MNVCTKSDIRSFTHSWDNMGTQKIWAVPGYAHAPVFFKIFHAGLEKITIFLKKSKKSDFFDLNRIFLI